MKRKRKIAKGNLTDAFTNLWLFTGLTFLLIVFVSSSSCSQSKSNGIEGKWRSTRIELKNGDTGEKFTLDGKPYAFGDTLIVIDSKFATDSRSNLSYKYEILGSELRIGDRKYLIEKHTNSELILLDITDPIDPLPFRTYYMRVK
jgi:hypothetical protein